MEKSILILCVINLFLIRPWLIGAMNNSNNETFEANHDIEKIAHGTDNVTSKSGFQFDAWCKKCEVCIVMIQGYVSGTGGGGHLAAIVYTRVNKAF